MKNVLIVSAHFPPLNTMAAKRYGYMCKYMEENGYKPYILTQRARGGAYLNVKMDLASPVFKEQIIRIGELGINYSIDDPVINQLIAEYKKEHVFSRVVEENSLGWFYKVKKELDLSKLQNIDIVVGTFPSVCNLLVAGYIAEKLVVPYVAEIRDLISDYEEDKTRNEVWNEREVFLEKSILDCAAGIITVTNGFSRIMKERYPNKRVATIYNGWDEENVGENVSSPPVTVEKYMYYAGTLYEHRVESIKLLIDTIYEYDLDIKLKIRSVGPEYLEIKLKKYISSLEMSNRVEVLSAAPECIVKEEQSKALINLIISSLNQDDVALMNTIPGKVFELIKLQQPVLAIANKKCEINEILERTRKGTTLCSKEQIKNFLINEYKEYEGTREDVSFFSRKTQSHFLCRFLDELVEGDNIMNKSILAGLTAIGVIAGEITVGAKLNDIIADKQIEKEKFRIMYQLMERWMRLKQSGKTLESFFNVYGYKNIAVYGLGDIGKLFINELVDSAINIIYGIDKNVNAANGIRVVSPNDDFEDVDVVVVTAIAYYGEIAEMLSTKMNCPIVSLEDIIYEVE